MGGNFLVQMISTCLPSRRGRRGGWGGDRGTRWCKRRRLGEYRNRFQLQQKSVVFPHLLLFHSWFPLSCYRRRVIVDEPVVSEDYHNTDIQSTKEENDDVITVTHQVRWFTVVQTGDQLIYLASKGENCVTATHQVFIWYLPRQFSSCFICMLNISKQRRRTICQYYSPTD